MKAIASGRWSVGEREGGDQEWKEQHLQFRNWDTFQLSVGFSENPAPLPTEL